MKFVTSLLVVVCAAAILTASPQQAPADMVQAGINAINNRDAAFFERHLADDVVWLDEDGHAIAGKQAVLGFVQRRLLAAPIKLTPTNIRVGNTTDAAWATFAYTIDKEGSPQKRGMNTTVYKKVGNDWQIVVVHGAVNTAGHQ